MSRHQKFIVTVSLSAAFAMPGIASAVAISGQGTWETTLQGRDLDGNLATFEAYYDTVLDITWLADTNFAGAGMSWENANNWAAALDPYGSGITGWRLPTTVDVGNDGITYTSLAQGVDAGYNITVHSEMSHMFYVTLGNLAYRSTLGIAGQPGWGLSNTGPFSNLLTTIYWSATEYASFTSYAWYFYFYDGFQNANPKTTGSIAWAVHTGDVYASAVPVPAAAWLFGGGLLGLVGFNTRRQRRM